MSMQKHLHIICPEIPLPINSGPVIDVFFKIRSLQKAGVLIHLHCFDSASRHQDELSRYANEVSYYAKREGHKGFSFGLPYIVGSRVNTDLAERLLLDDYPILMEGIQTSFLAHDERFRNRKIFIREQRLQYNSYSKRYTNSWNPLRQLYNSHESKILKAYEARTFRTIPVCCVSDKDRFQIQQQLHARQVIKVPLFLPFQQVCSHEGIGSYCLYHGNLSDAANEKAAFYLLNQVFNDLPVPFVVAGKNPSRRLLKAAKRSKFHCLVENPTEAELQDMIEKAQVNILPSFDCNGIKLKLLNALFNGRHCVVNDATVEGTGLEPATHIASSAKAFKSIIAQLYHQPFAGEEIVLRKQLLEKEYNNELNAKRLIQWIW
ncbi:MAG TPA: glycosyltransferase [Flavitalea sp.]|nr:glycosyltransferase [Flavitalea sp.]